MRSTISIILSPEEEADDLLLKKKAAEAIFKDADQISFIKKLKRSTDARRAEIKILLTLEVYSDQELPEASISFPEYPDVRNEESVIIAGSGPAGLFAALKLIRLGYKPIILERGKDVKSRRRDLAAINKDHLVNPDSNYCFGEGGAGTYSDGKLYTRSTKRGDVTGVLQTLVAYGAKEDILYEAHPHIGTNKLPALVSALRESILRAGGELHFNCRLTDIIIRSGEFKAVETQNGDRIEARACILATGHSARDIFEMLNRHEAGMIETKSFALGVRIEHPQALIDQIQYHCKSKEDVEKKRLFLPASPYNLVTQVQNKGVFSFCMCPGGFIVPSSTAQEEVVLNGMSPSKRDSRFANSGIVVAVEAEELTEYKKYGALAALRFQQDVEKTAWEAGGKSLAAPAQRMVDFVNKKFSTSLPDTSYQPGVKSTQLTDVLPEFIGSRLRHAFKDFGNKMKGYFTNEAIILGVESRTSSPVRIPRDKESLQHPMVKGLYPCGEGAGYAGGIISAAIDGERCAEKSAEFLSGK
jgi:uncharacterized FAD-dependent dehydrogenase